MIATGTQRRPGRQGRHAAQRRLARAVDRQELHADEVELALPTTSQDLERWADGARIVLWDRRTAVVVDRAARRPQLTSCPVRSPAAQYRL